MDGFITIFGLITMILILSIVSAYFGWLFVSGFAFGVFLTLISITIFILYDPS